MLKTYLDQILILCLLALPLNLYAASELQVGDEAPLFSTRTHSNENFNFKMQEGRWTVLYFFPKANTPGCTAQAIDFNKNQQELKKLNVDVFGISTDEVETLQKFHQEYKLQFTLLADPEMKIVSAYDTKMFLLNYSKRWTFIIDPNLKIRFINKDVDSSKDGEMILDTILKLQQSLSSLKDND